MALPFITRRALGAASVLALGLTPFALAGTAHADPLRSAGTFGSAVAEDDARLIYTAVPGVENDVVASVRWSTGGDKLVYVIDDVVRIKAGGPCTHPDADDSTKVRCVVAPPEDADAYATLTMMLGDRNDHVSFANNTKQSYFFSKFVLGPGSDHYRVTTRTIDGSLVLGQGGDDEIRAGARAAAIGGIGNDALTVFGKDSAASAGAGDDKVWGSAGPQHLIAGPGDDQVWGGAGNDQIFGEDGDDRLWGQEGDDLIRGDNGDDRIWGGKGKDVLRGGPGRNIVKK